MTKWIEAQVPRVQSLLKYILKTEAQRFPSIASVLLRIATNPGRMFRSRLVFLGAASEYRPLDEVFDPLEDEEKEWEGVCQQLRSLNWQKISKEEMPDLWLEQKPKHWALSNRFFLVASAIEILHLATLIHDDVIDGAPLRRGLETVHRVVGVPQAVLLGDYLFSLSFGLLNENLPRPMLRILASCFGLMAQAELEEIEFKDQFFEMLERPSKLRYLKLIGKKTGLLVALSLLAGASMAGAEQNKLENLGRAGYSLGIAFQIHDDLKDYLGDSTSTGKPTGLDLKDRFITLPLIEGLTVENNPSQKTELINWITIYVKTENLSEQEKIFQKVVGRLHQLGAFERVNQEKENYIQRCLSQVTDLKTEFSALVSAFINKV